MPALVLGQQFPAMEGYCVNPLNLSPAYAGIRNSKTLFLDYRSDWTGIDGGPKTYQLSYSSKFKNRVGLGGRFIYDKTDIFKQTLILGTYTYEINFKEDNSLTFGLSAGLYRNSIDLTKYYNDPAYVQDLVLINGLQTSRIKFASDISILYKHKNIDAGIYFSNMMFGTAKYRNTDMTYKPLKNYLLHISYLIKLDDKWSVEPLAILRGGEHVPLQFEISPTAYWNNRFWGTAVVRSSGTIGFGLGGEIYKGLLLNYSYSLNNNINSRMPANPFGSHQITLGIRLFGNHKDQNSPEE